MPTNNDLQSYLNSFYSPEELQEAIRRQRKSGVYDPTMANNLNLARDRWNTERMGSSKTVGQLSYPELSLEAQKLLARDQSRLAGSNYPAYKGKTTVPMSSLTQRQRELQEGFRAKGAPYAKKLENVLGRNAQGLSPEQTQGILDMLRTGQGAANENLGLGYMQKQFGERYGNREQRLREKGSKDLARVSNTSRGALEQLSNNTRDYENTYNENLANTLRGLQGVKQNRREKLTDVLGEYGNQKHAYGNLVNDINKGEFNRQVNEPYRKMDLLKNLIQGQGETEGVDPGVEAANHKMLQQGLKAYGIDTSKPLGEWEKNRQETSKYPGQLVADLTPEIMTSHNLAERISPKWQEATFGERKRLEKGAMNKESLGTRATAKLPENLKPYEENLDWATKKMIKNELGKLNRKYEGLGTYGSQAHLGALEKRQRELLRSSYGERENLTHKVLGRNMLSEGTNDINELRRLVQLGQLSKDEFDDIIKKNKELNQLGTTKWGNEQNKLGGEYQNYQNELSWEWPNMRQSIIGEIGNKKNANNALQQKYDLDLDTLRNQHAASYSELEKEHRNLQNDILTKKGYLTAQPQVQNNYNQLAKQAEDQRRYDAERKRQEETNKTTSAQRQRASENANRQRALQDALSKIAPPPEGAFYSPENGNWYTRPLVYNNEYVNEAWKGAPNFARGVEQAAALAASTGGPKFPYTGAGGWSGNYAYKDILPIYDTLKRHQYS
jgi:hypothetical protein